MSVARKVAPAFGGSYTDLTEWDSGTSRLVIADSHGIAFGDDNDLDFYSSSGIGCMSRPSAGVAAGGSAWSLDPARFVTQFTYLTFSTNTYSAPYTKQNVGHALLAGVEAVNNAIYVVSASANARIMMANESTPATAMQFNYAVSTSAFSMFGTSSQSIQIGDSGDKVAILGATPIVKQSHLTDPTNESELVTWAANLNTQRETFGSVATS